MDERTFWVEVRRWLKIQNQANQQMVAAIEARFGLGPERREQRQQEHRPPKPAA